MNTHARITVGNDLYELKKAASAESALNFVAHLSLPPRPDQYGSWFVHDHNVTIMALDGKVQLDINGNLQLLEPLGFKDVPAQTPYRVKGYSHLGVHALIWFDHEDVFGNWKEVGDEINKRGTVWRDGVTRHR